MGKGIGVYNLPMKWYYKPVFVILALLGAGPFALPLLWLSPSFSKAQRIVITAIVVILTIWTIKLSVDLYGMLSEEFRELDRVLDMM
jgi:hypothetical protein